MARRIRSWLERSRVGTPAPVCDDLAAWASSAGAEYEVVDRAFTTTRPLPLTIEPEVDPSFALHLEIDVPERALVTIPRAGLSGGTGVVVLPGGEVVGELLAVTPEGRRAMAATHAPRPTSRGTDRVPGTAFALLGIGATHYYHWCHDVIMSSRGIGDLLAPDTAVIVPEGLRPWQRATLELLGLGDRPMVELPRSATWAVDELQVFVPRLKTQLDSAAPFHWFRQSAFARCATGGPTRPRRLYLSRRLDNHWRTTNEVQVEALLMRMGFESVAPAGLSFCEQVRLFADAGVIVGTGAGLFNMVFSPPGTKILQLQDPTHVVHALWTEAAAMGFEYHYLMCEAVANADAPDADLRVPLEKLGAALAAMGVE